MARMDRQKANSDDSRTASEARVSSPPLTPASLLPWRAQGTFILTGGDDPMTVACADDGDILSLADAFRDARYIVRSANAFPALVEALKGVTEFMDRAGGDGYGMPECPWCRSQADDDGHLPDCELVKAREALALATAPTD